MQESNKNDLNSKLFYKVQFSVKPVAGWENTDILWDLVMHVKKWLSYKRIRVSQKPIHWTSFKNGGKLYDHSEAGDFFAESIKRIDPNNEKNVSWACFIRERTYQQGYAPRYWTTEIGYQSSDGESALLTFVLSYEDAMGYIGQTMPEPDISVPRIVINIQTDKKYVCEVNGDPLLFEAVELRTGEGYRFRELLMDPFREIPVILILPKRDYWEKEKINLSVSPNKMIKSVGGNALVYYSNDLMFVEELKSLFDSNYKCTGGMIRLYLPKINRDDPNDCNRHRFIHYDDAVKMTEKVVLRIFRRVLAQDINDYEVLFRYKNCQDLIRRDKLQARIEEISNKKEIAEREVENDIVSLRAKIDDLDLKNTQLQINNMTYEEEIVTLKRENHNFRSQIESLNSSFEPFRVAKEAVDGIRELCDYPNTPECVFDYFTTVFPERIDLTEQGWKSLKYCRTSPEILWGILFAMVTELYDCLNCMDSFVNACSEFSNRATCKCIPGNGATTKKDRDLMKNFLDEYHGQTINIEPHVASNTGKESDPRFYRIYFAVITDNKTHLKKIIVGSCGGHMDTAGTKYQS